MARIRTIKPQFFLNEQLAELSALTRLLYIGLWTQADREGKLIDRPKRIKAEIFPYENFDVEKGLNDLQKTGFIFRYKANVNIFDRVLAPEQPVTEVSIIKIVNFSKHQKIDKANEKESELPEPEQGYYSTSNSLVIAGEGKGKEGNKERKGKDNAQAQSIFDFKKYLVDYGFEANLVEDWLKVRKNKRATNSETALLDFISEFEKKENADKNETMRLIVSNSWSGFRWSWLEEKKLNNGKGTAKNIEPPVKTGTFGKL